MMMMGQAKNGGSLVSLALGLKFISRCGHTQQLVKLMDFFYPSMRPSSV